VLKAARVAEAYRATSGNSAISIRRGNGGGDLFIVVEERGRRNAGRLVSVYFFLIRQAKNN
jgi:hypothetical protein